MSMEITRASYAQATFASIGEKTAKPNSEKTRQASIPVKAQTDRVEISAQSREDIQQQQEAESKTTVAFNAGKRARQLAAAKTRSQVQVVMELLSQDLAECKAGLENGWCDENEVAKVEAMIRQAQSKMAQVAGNDEEEPLGVSAFDLAGLM